MQREMTNEEYDAAVDFAYLFNLPEGERVLRYLRGVCYLDEPAPLNPDDDGVTKILKGQRREGNREIFETIDKLKKQGELIRDADGAETSTMSIGGSASTAETDQ